MATITQLVETLNTTIDEANTDIEKLERCNECMATCIEDNQHLISWNRGCIPHAEFTLGEIEKGQKTAIREVATPDLEEHWTHDVSGKDWDRIRDDELRIGLVSALYEIMGHLTNTKVMVEHPTTIRAFCDQSFDEHDKRDQWHLLQVVDDVLSLIQDKTDGLEKSIPPPDNDLRIRLASALHDLTTHWMKVAIKHPDIGRDFLDKPFDELASIDKYAALRDADTILDFLRGKQ